MVISNLEFDIRSVWKQQETFGQETIQGILIEIFLIEYCIELNKILISISRKFIYQKTSKFKEKREGFDLQIGIFTGIGNNK